MLYFDIIDVSDGIVVTKASASKKKKKKKIKKQKTKKSVIFVTIGIS